MYCGMRFRSRARVSTYSARRARRRPEHFGRHHDPETPGSPLNRSRAILAYPTIGDKIVGMADGGRRSESIREISVHPPEPSPPQGRISLVRNLGKSKTNDKENPFGECALPQAGPVPPAALVAQETLSTLPSCTPPVHSSIPGLRGCSRSDHGRPCRVVEVR